MASQSCRRNVDGCLALCGFGVVLRAWGLKGFGFRGFRVWQFGAHCSRVEGVITVGFRV